MEYLRLLVFLAAAAAMFMDLQREKVPNCWIVLLWCLGCGLCVIRDGVSGFLSFSAGAGLPLLLLGWLFLFRMLGAGDIKLLSALGGLMGTAGILRCMVFSLLFGGFLSAALLVDMGNMRQRIEYFAGYVKEVLQTGEIRAYRSPGKRAENLHFTVPVFMAAACYAGGIF